MNLQNLEDRVATLEHEVAALKANGARTKDWRRTIGMFSDDPDMQEVFREAMKIREADRKRARRRPAKRKQTR